MREIKFRGKAWFGGEWQYGLLDKGTGDYTYIKSGHVGVRVAPETVGQFTGLRDKDGNEIYEGDFVRYYNSLDEKFQNYEVFWDNLSCAFFGTMQGCDFFQLRADLDMLVQGNIHDNPDLLKP